MSKEIFLECSHKGTAECNDTCLVRKGEPVLVDTWERIKDRKGVRSDGKVPYYCGIAPEVYLWEIESENMTDIWR